MRTRYNNPTDRILALLEAYEELSIAYDMMADQACAYVPPDIWTSMPAKPSQEVYAMEMVRQSRNYAKGDKGAAARHRMQMRLHRLRKAGIAEDMAPAKTTVDEPLELKYEPPTPPKWSLE